jgi:hypothetical protein
MIDADVQSVQYRLSQLGGALAESGAEPIEGSEQIALLIPKRNVERWILCLTNEVVDEVIDYKEKRDDWNSLIPRASEALFRWTRPNATLSNQCISSLRLGVRELN